MALALCDLSACSARGPATRPAQGQESVVLAPKPPGRPIDQLEGFLKSSAPEERAAGAWEFAGAAEVNAGCLSTCAVWPAPTRASAFGKPLHGPIATLKP
jgi:hypothetical protein